MRRFSRVLTAALVAAASVTGCSIAEPNKDVAAGSLADIASLKEKRIASWKETANRKEPKPAREILDVVVAMVALGMGGVFGEIIAQGTPEEVAETPGSATGEYLRRVLPVYEAERALA